MADWGFWFVLATYCATVDYDTDFGGTDMYDTPVSGGVAACCALCHNTQGCQAFVFRPLDGNCWLKSAPYDKQLCVTAVGLVAGAIGIHVSFHRNKVLVKSTRLEIVLQMV